jgi:dTDP-4-amino-4,6-dideoxygalactose transaminase
MTADIDPIFFNRAYITGDEFDYMREAIGNAHLASGGPFSRRCVEWLIERTGCRHALLTHSCTAALEMAFTLANIGPDDEVIMPSFTFVSTANSVVGRRGRPVFVDIRADTLCIDEQSIEQAITPRTKAIVPVHYAGVACEMDVIIGLARAHDLLVIEDAAQGIGSTVSGSPLGSIGQLGTLSFHETKNVSCGEGGALLVSDERFVDRADIILEKGTDRRRFSRGEVAKYTWVDVGSSYGLSELAAAYLFAQLEHESEIRRIRTRLWNAYHSAFADLENDGHIRRPIIPDSCDHNAHMYYLLVADLKTRTKLIAYLAARGIHAVFHYVPLHSSEAGQRYARAVGHLQTTTEMSGRVVRLPLWANLGDDSVERVASTVHEFFADSGSHGRPASRWRRTRSHSVEP